jgi:hypothetical protein
MIASIFIFVAVNRHQPFTFQGLEQHSMTEIRRVTGAFSYLLIIIAIACKIPNRANRQGKINLNEV